MLFCGNERHNDLDGRPLCGGGAEEVLGALEGRSHVIPRDFVRLLVSYLAASCRRVDAIRGCLDQRFTRPYYGRYLFLRSSSNGVAQRAPGPHRAEASSGEVAWSLTPPRSPASRGAW